MMIARHTDTELVLDDSMIWLAILLALASLPPLYDAMILGSKKSFILPTLLLLSALLCVRKSSCTFDRLRRMASLHTRWLFRVRERSVPFDDISDVTLQADMLGQQKAQYRLAMVTCAGAIPLAGAYGSGSTRYEAMCQTVRDFLTCGSQPSALKHAPPTAHAPASNPALAAAVRPILDLLHQGRKIEAISLFRTTHSVSLAEAKGRVDEIAEQLRPEN